jgi:cysteine-rich repeat protein
MVSGTCQCNNDLKYFTDNAGSCPPCVIVNCTKCSALTTCIACNLDSFVTNAGACQLSVCGNGDTEGIEQCDDGNAIAGDGCTACQIDPFYYCVNAPPPSACFYDSRFNVQVTEILAACNQVTFKFQIYPYYNYYDAANFDAFINTNTLSASTKLTAITRSADTVAYTYTFTKTLQNIPVQFILDPTALMIPQTNGYPPITLTFNVVPTNNVLALYYEESVCKSASTMKKLAAVLEYGSYATMALSALPCKIVGLELTGVIQLSFFSMASMDNVNIMMSPMMGMKGINGFAIGMGKDPSKKRMLQTQTLTPSRVNSIGYNANFLRNCNVMLMLVLAVIAVAFTLYIITYIFKKCAETLHKVAKRMIKEVLLTLILFNCLNFAYSAGIHFRYAVPEDDLYLFGTLAAAATLVLPVLMAIGLSMAEEDGFGEFKEKMKPGCI